MVTITFPDRETEKLGLGFLMTEGFSSRVLRNGMHFVPEEALAALAHENIPFTALGTLSYEKELAALRAASATSVQRRKARPRRVTRRSRARAR